MKKCAECNEEFEMKDLVPICKKNTYIYGEPEDLSGKYVCIECLKDPEEYANCSLCSEDVAYRMDDLREANGSFYCGEHISETFDEYDDENE